MIERTMGDAEMEKDYLCDYVYITGHIRCLWILSSVCIVYQIESNRIQSNHIQ
jgi:hypothetical protein